MKKALMIFLVCVCYVFLAIYSTYTYLFVNYIFMGLGVVNLLCSVKELNTDGWIYALFLILFWPAFLFILAGLWIGDFIDECCK